MEQAKNKKNLKNLLQEKPVDYDEGMLFFVLIYDAVSAMCKHELQTMLRNLFFLQTVA